MLHQRLAVIEVARRPHRGAVSDAGHHEGGAHARPACKPPSSPVTRGRGGGHAALDEGWTRATSVSASPVSTSRNSRREETRPGVSGYYEPACQQCLRKVSMMETRREFVLLAVYLPARSTAGWLRSKALRVHGRSGPTRLNRRSEQAQPSNSTTDLKPAFRGFRPPMTAIVRRWSPAATANLHPYLHPTYRCTPGTHLFSESSH